MMLDGTFSCSEEEEMKRGSAAVAKEDIGRGKSVHLYKE